MSRYSGKCDLADEIAIFGLENVLASKIYIGDSTEPLGATTYKDLIPYLPYTVSGACYHSGQQEIRWLSKESWVDREEREILNMYKNILVKYYRKCKRNHEEMDIKKAIEYVAFAPSEEIYKLAVRVKTQGDKASIDGLHTPAKDMYRQLLVDEMCKYGIDPVEYGYERFVEQGGNQY